MSEARRGPRVSDAISLRGTETILLVEDDPLEARTLVSLLAREYTAVSAAPPTRPVLVRVAVGALQPAVSNRTI